MRMATPAQNGDAALVPEIVVHGADPSDGVKKIRYGESPPAGPATSGTWRLPLESSLSTPGPRCQSGRASVELTPPPVPLVDRNCSQPTSDRYVPSARTETTVPPTEIVYGLSDGKSATWRWSV